MRRVVYLVRPLLIVVSSTSVVLPTKQVAFSVLLSSPTTVFDIPMLGVTLNKSEKGALISLFYGTCDSACACIVILSINNTPK